jgi:hypothetical protein
MTRIFDVIVERDEEGWLVASVPGLHGCHTQARTLEHVMERVREVPRRSGSSSQADARTQSVSCSRLERRCSGWWFARCISRQYNRAPLRTQDPS